MKNRLQLILLLASLFILPASSVSALDGSFFSSNDIIYYDPNSQTCTQTDSASSPVSEATPGTLDIPKDFTLGDDGSKRAVELLKNLMKDYNLTDFQAAGIVGNFMVESGALSLPPDWNEGDRAGAAPKFSGGYGWAQWTGGRQVTFINYAVSAGYMPNKETKATDAANYAYLNQELSRGGYNNVISAIKKTTTVAGAMTAWEKLFEIAGVPALGTRLTDAQLALDAYRGNGVISGASSSTSDSADTTGTSGSNCTDGNTSVQTSSTVFDSVTFPLAGGKSVVNNPEIFKNNTTAQGGHPYTAFDIYANAGTKVVAFTAGVVTHTSVSDLGQSVSIYNQKAGLVVYYTHMSPSKYVQEGKTVQPGDYVGQVASVKDYPGVNVDHLHIDASKGKYRVECSRDSCPPSSQALFVDIGPDLYNAYQKAGGSGE